MDELLRFKRVQGHEDERILYMTDSQCFLCGGKRQLDSCLCVECEKMMEEED